MKRQLSVQQRKIEILENMLEEKTRHLYLQNKFLQEALSDKEILLKEIHHRVKNNLQVITSLLSLQSSFIKDDNVKYLFRSSQRRLKTMALIHEMLYQSSDLTTIDYKEYLEGLVNGLIETIKARKTNIQVKIEMDNIFLNLDTSIPLGLIVNEIITNSCKHGFSEEIKGCVSIKIRKMKYPNFVMLIGDNGKGYSDDQNFRNSNTLGLTLVNKLILQLNGTIVRDVTKRGTNYIIEFQEIEQKS